MDGLDDKYCCRFHGMPDGKALIIGIVVLSSHHSIPTGSFSKCSPTTVAAKKWSAPKRKIKTHRVERSFKIRNYGDAMNQMKRSRQ
jgi:hypothetical protein